MKYLFNRMFFILCKGFMGWLESCYPRKRPLTSLNVFNSLSKDIWLLWIVNSNMEWWIAGQTAPAILPVERSGTCPSVWTRKKSNLLWHATVVGVGWSCWHNMGIRSWRIIGCLLPGCHGEPKNIKDHK